MAAMDEVTVLKEMLGVAADLDDYSTIEGERETLPARSFLRCVFVSLSTSHLTSPHLPSSLPRQP